MCYFNVCLISINVNLILNEYNYYGSPLILIMIITYQMSTDSIYVFIYLNLLDKLVVHVRYSLWEKYLAFDIEIEKNTLVK